MMRMMRNALIGALIGLMLLSATAAGCALFVLALGTVSCYVDPMCHS
jgi:hypothetical protein